jgi:chromosome segregation ATPase
LAPGVSDQEKERLQAELAEITRRYDESKPAVAEARQKLAETEGLAQEAREKLKLARENLSNLGKLQGRKDTTEAKLREAEKELGVDGDAKKKGHIDQLEKRIHASLQALEAHSESYKKMMKATIKSTGIRLNMEAAKAVEIRLRYVHLST